MLGKEHLHYADAYVNKLRACGVKIGRNLQFSGFNMGRPMIDVTRPSLVEIGDNVLLNRNFTLLTHDHVTGIFKRVYNEFVPSSGPVKIGDNVRFGFDCTVLKGVTIGNNCFIAAGSIVTKDIPDNSVAAGRPAKVICSLDDYYHRRLTQCVDEAMVYARSIRDRFGRMPVPEDFWEEFPLFVDGSNVNDYPMIPVRQQLGDAYDHWLAHHKAQFHGFDEFMKAAFSE